MRATVRYYLSLMSILTGIYALSMFRCSMEAQVAQHVDQAAGGLRTSEPIETRRISSLLVGSKKRS